MVTVMRVAAAAVRNHVVRKRAATDRAYAVIVVVGSVVSGRGHIVDLLPHDEFSQTIGDGDAANALTGN